MEKKIRVSAVSYLNATPFVYGLQNSEVSKQTKLSLDNPAECARKLIYNEADIGLVPIAAIGNIPNAKIVSDYCIAANGEVASVLLISNVPLKEIRSVIMDNESRTSVLLAKVLAHFYWEIKPEWLNEKNTDLQNLNENTAAVVIGDRALSLRSAYPYKYDLAYEWKKFTGLPFVFACWVANTEIDKNYLNLFNEALKYGLDHRHLLIESLSNKNYDVRKYLNDNILYLLDDENRKGMEKFFALAKQI